MTASASPKSAPRVERRSERFSWTPPQGHRDDHPTVPITALIAAGAIMAATLAFAYVASRTDAGSVRVAPIAAIATATVSFETRADGAVATRDAAGRVHVTPEKQSGFIRGVLRALARDRRAAGLAAEPITARIDRAADGRMAITDTATGRRIELLGFGDTHYRAFERLLASAESSAPRAAGD